MPWYIVKCSGNFLEAKFCNIKKTLKNIRLETAESYLKIPPWYIAKCSGNILDAKTCNVKKPTVGNSILSYCLYQYYACCCCFCFFFVVKKPL